MKINFVLPFFPTKPGGGTKIIYEYAKRLSDRGHDIVIYHNMKMPYVINADKSNLKIIFKYFLRKLKFQKKKRPNWFILPDKIICKLIPFVTNNYIRDADIIISTWWETAIVASELDPIKGHRVNFIQGYEDWNGFIELLHKSYKIKNNTNIVVASYLYNIVAPESHNKTYLIPNSVDTSLFFSKNPPEKRESASILFMYSELEWKGSIYTLEALVILKEKYPNFIVSSFGIHSRPNDLPEWIDYYQNPSDLNTLYNNSSIFISTSLQEGWGLTPMEAMACGCACIATRIDGHLEYMVDEVNALLIPVQNVQAIVEKVSYLIDNDRIRLNFVDEGLKTIEKFSWNNSLSKFESILSKLLEKNLSNQR